MTDFWIWRDERGFKLATAMQSGAPKHAGIHLQGRIAPGEFARISGTFPVLKGGRLSVGGHKRQAGYVDLAQEVVAIHHPGRRLRGSREYVAA
jgi:hypothetical protein